MTGAAGQPAATATPERLTATAPAAESSPATDAASSATSEPPPGPQPVSNASAPASAEAQAPLEASGPAIGGPKNNRPCEFHESVDSYQRLCTTTKNPDGSLHVVAKGTKLNPDNGFEFTLHGGPHNFVAHGTLNAFYRCAGPFTAYVSTVIDKGVTTYELRFKEHCKIVVR
jgi:hypothetical protein